MERQLGLKMHCGALAQTDHHRYLLKNQCQHDTLALQKIITSRTRAGRSMKLGTRLRGLSGAKRQRRNELKILCS